MRANEQTDVRVAHAVLTSVFLVFLNLSALYSSPRSCLRLSEASEVDDILARAAIAKRILESGNDLRFFSSS